MLKISKLADYAVVVLGALQRQPEGGAAAELAAQVRLPQTTVAKVLKLLAKAGLVQASRGASGGYRLLRDARAIPVTEVIAAIDGPVKLTDCVGEHQGCLQNSCSLRGRWDPVNRAIVTALNDVTLADLLGAAPIIPAYAEAS